MSGLQYMSGLDVFICIVLLAPLEKWATEAQGKTDLVSVKTPAYKCLKCKMAPAQCPHSHYSREQ